MHGRTSNSAMWRTARGRTRHTARACRGRWASRLSNNGPLPNNKTCIGGRGRPARFAGRHAGPLGTPGALSHRRIVLRRDADRAEGPVCTHPLEIKMSNSVAPKLLAEFIGTFALVFIGAGAASIVGGATGGGITAIAFAHGLTLMIFICAYGSVSGGHFNPAVTVGVLAAGAITAAEAAGYIVSQIAGGAGAALVVRIVP